MWRRERGRYDRGRDIRRFLLDLLRSHLNVSSSRFYYGDCSVNSISFCQVHTRQDLADSRLDDVNNLSSRDSRDDLPCYTEEIVDKRC